MCWSSLVRIAPHLEYIAPHICVTYLSDMYEYKHDTSTRLIRVQFIVQPSLEIATCLVYLSLVATTTSSTYRAYCIDHRTTWPYRYLCVYLVWMRLKWRRRKSDIISCLKEHKVQLCWTAITQTPVILYLDQSCWLLHTGSTQIHIIPTGYEHSRYARTSSLSAHSLLVLVISKNSWKIDGI